MKILVATSDNYSFLVEPYHTLFNKYWPNQEIVFLGFDESKVPPLPDNCSFHSLGKQEDFGSLWTDPLIPYIDSLEDEYFVFTVEDVMLMEPVDLEKAAILEEEIRDHGASKALLDTHLNHSTFSYKEGLRAMRGDAEYRTTLHPSIWRKEYFQKYLKPGMNAWDFEVQNMRESMNDGAIIVSLDQEEDLYSTSNVYRKGVPFPRYDCPRPYGSSSEEVNMEDIEFILGYVRKNELST